MDTQTIGEVSSKLVLASLEIAIPRGFVVQRDDEAGRAARMLRPPYVVKIVSSDVVHKSDVGGVVLNLRTSGEVQTAVASLRRQAAVSGWRLDSFLIEEMQLGGHELIVAGFVDERFGPMVMVGMGGIYVEMLPEVAFRFCPIGENDVRAMVGEVPGIKVLLEGARGQAKASEAALIQVLLQIGGRSGLLSEYGEMIETVEINPLRLDPSSAVALDARIMVRGTGHEPAGGDSVPLPAPDFRRLFTPASVAVAGASSNRVTLGNVFIRHLRAYGYRGTIFPIHPTAATIEGLPAFSSVVDIPDPIDYSYLAVAPPDVISFLDGAQDRLGFVQVITSGYGELESGSEREAELLQAARRAHARLLGPNCLGTHSPRGRLTYLEHPSAVLGGVGVISQSGGLSLDIASLGDRLGIEFSGIVTIGNSVDLGPTDLLEFFEQDDVTTVIGAYLEDVKDGRRFARALARVCASKSVVTLIGGQTPAGRRAASSHTGALATEERKWKGIAAQTGSVLTETLDQFLESLAGLQAIIPNRHRVTEEVALFGTGGGISVLSADLLEREGFSVSPLPPKAATRLAALRLPAGASIANPVDTPSGALIEGEGSRAIEILRILLEDGEVDAVVVHLNLASFISFTDSAAEFFSRVLNRIGDLARKHSDRTHVLVALRSSGESHLDATQREEIARGRRLGLAMFTRIEGAVNALAALRAVERYRSRLTGPG